MTRIPSLHQLDNRKQDTNTWTQQLRCNQCAAWTPHTLMVWKDVTYCQCKQCGATRRA